MPIDAQRVQTVFLAASEIRDPTERARFLDGACDRDPELRSRVEALLRAHDDPDSLLDRPVVGAHDPDSATTRTIGPGGESGTDDESPLTFLSPAQRPDSLGRIGHHEVLQVLGRGGFGIVFRAFDEVLHRVVAVKVLAPQMAATSPARKRFLREARSSAQVRHENVVQVYEVGEQPLPYIVMEFIPGETLQQRLERTGPLDVADVVRIGRQIAEGLAAAHATDLIHRDIKPANVLLEGGHHKVKITDFGLARAADDASLSQSGLIAGTPMFMAPEQATGDKLDHRADLFSLGSVMYQLVTGRPPFRATGTLAVLKRVAEDTPRPIREIIPEAPQWLCDIISKLHAKDPGERFQTARDVADVLADCEHQLKSNARLKDFSRIPRSKTTPARSGGWKWVVAVLLLPAVALAITELNGVTHLFRQQSHASVEPKADDEADAKLPRAPVAPGGTLLPTYTSSIGMEFVIVPKGKSWLGGGKNKPGEREVEIPTDFYLGKCEVTQEQWERVMKLNPSHFRRTGGGRDAVRDVPDADLKHFPVENVTWGECQTFVAKANELEKESGWAYRLPTSAEWEYACRGGPMSNRAESAYDFYLAKPTDKLSPDRANYLHDKSLNRTCKVGSYEPNRLGLFDMHGNVWEWCNDLVDPKGWSRVDRGGSCQSESGHAVASHFFIYPEWSRYPHLGLRLARVRVPARLPEVKPPADSDRRAAEYVLSVGGAIRLNGEDMDIRSASDLPKEPFRVTLIALRDRPDLTDSDLAVFDGCQHLNTIILWGSSKVSDAGLRYFAQSKQIRFLGLGGTAVTDAGLVPFKELTTLETLHLSSLPVTGDGLMSFKRCDNLKYLNLESCPKLTDDDVPRLLNWPELSELVLDGTGVTDARAAQLAALKKLTLLRLLSTQVTAKGVEELAKALPKCKITWDGGVIEPK